MATGEPTTEPSPRPGAVFAYAAAGTALVAAVIAFAVALS
jgi:hypothetical protein